MNPHDKADAIKRYEDRLNEHGTSMKALGWRDEEQQKLRFKILSEIGDLHGKKVLDVGCGFGDLYGFLKGKGIDTDFTGYDITPKFIKEAKKKYPDARFEVRDIQSEKISETFDYVLSSGVFNHMISDNISFTKDMLKRMFEMSREGVAVNMMTDRVDFKDKHLHYYSPEKMVTFTKSLTRHFTVRHDYGLYEFTLYLLRSPLRDRQFS